MWGQQGNAFSPWEMGISFGGGQLLGALILYWNLERSNGS
jgi:prolipoprotein diacylglyceryltransferase